MGFLDTELGNTKLPVLLVDRDELRHYSQIGFGDEGAIYKYSDRIAIKTFEFTSDKDSLFRKFEKIELLGKLSDDAACFPIGLVGYENMKKEGYYYKLVKTNPNIKDFDYLDILKDKKRVLEYILKAEDALKRFHEMGLILGDIKGDNIMIDADDNIKFVDTDNWMYGDFGFDLVPSRAKWLWEIYNKKLPLKDNDIFVFAIMAISYLINNEIYYHRTPEYFEKFIEYLSVTREIKEGFRAIFSDATNKPYIGDILKNIDLENEIISNDDIRILRYVR